MAAAIHAKKNNYPNIITAILGIFLEYFLSFGSSTEVITPT